MTGAQIHQFMEAGTAVLGICHGAPLINVALGGSLHQDIATQLVTAGMHGHPVYDQHSQAIEWESNSGLSKRYPGTTGDPVVSACLQEF